MKKIISTALFCLVTGTYSQYLSAGFLDMPEISETPELRGKTMVRDIDVPGVRDRNPDPNSGPRLAVKEFRIQGLVEYPELGITRKALDKLIERLRFVFMGEGKLLESGYTLDELAELSDLLVEIEDETLNRHVTPLEVQKLVWLIREQRAKRGITLGQIEVIADKITRFYRERGFILAKAYIPKQEVRDGIVNLTLLLGALGEVNVHGNKLYGANIISRAFDGMLTKPVTHAEVEENLYLINDYPGLVVDGFFEPGYQVGDTRLKINVKDEDRFSSNVRIDNHGTDATGLYRVYADAQINNTINMADSLHVSVLEAFSPSNTSYWRVNYGMNLYSPRWKFNLGASKNQYIIDNSTNVTVLVFDGAVDVLETSLKYILKKSRSDNYSLEYKFEDMESDLIINGGSPQPEHLKNNTLTFNYDVLNEADRRLHQGNIKYRTGEILEGAKAGQEDKYDVFSTDYTLLTFMKVPFFESDSRFIFRTNFQYSDTTLSSMLRFSLGGPTRARAYDAGLFTADDAIFLGADWVFNSPDFLNFKVGDVNIMELIKPFVFIDYSYGQQLAAGIENVNAELSDWGFGLQFSHGKNFKGNLQIAFPSHQEFSHPDTIEYEKEERFVFDFQYSF